MAAETGAKTRSVARLSYIQWTPITRHVHGCKLPHAECRRGGLNQRMTRKRRIKGPERHNSDERSAFAAAAASWTKR
jgi:hypothetical protein